MNDNMEFDNSISSKERFEILELIANYSYLYDEDRIPEFVELFMLNAESSIYIGGSKQPVVFAQSNAERLVSSQEMRSGPTNQAGKPRHMQTNTILNRLSDDLIAGKTMVVCTQQPHDGSAATIMFSGIYEDEFVRTSSGWKFLKRKGLLD